MTAMLGVLLRARWAALLAVAVLAAVLGGLASVASAYPDRAGDRLAADAVADAPPGDRSLRLSANSSEMSAFESQVAGVRKEPGLTTVVATQLSVLGFTENSPSTMLYREDFCVHIRLVSGRCPVSPGEVAVPEDQARKLDVTVGEVLDVAEAVFNERTGWQRSPDGSHPLDVVAVYAPIAAGGDYWGSPGPFQTQLDGSLTGPVLVVADTFPLIPHGAHMVTADIVVAPEVITGRSWETFVDETLLPNLISEPDSGLPDLMGTIADQRSFVQVMTPAVVAPVLGFGCLVLFLLVSRRVQRDRTELGVQSVRGLALPLRWLLGAGPPALAVVAGLLAGAVVAGRFAGGSAAGWWVAIALGGALAAVAVAVLPVVAARPIDALRRVGPSAGTGRSRLPIGEAAVVVLAVTSLALARTGDAQGLGVFAPALVAAAVALVAARATPVLLRPVARWGLRTGRLVTGLAAAQLGRRPTGRHLVALTALAAGLLTLVAGTADAARTAREQRIAVEVGAERVLTVSGAEPAEVLAAVRSADPDGRYAMAAGRVGDSEGSPALLALDLSRVGVLDWTSASNVEPLLRSQPPAPPVRGRVALELTIRKAVPAGAAGPGLTLEVTTAAGVRRSVTLGAPSAPGRHTLTADLGDSCADGCRIDGIRGRGLAEVGWILTLQALTADGAPVGDVGSWRAFGETSTGADWPVGGELGRTEAWLLPPEAPAKLAAAVTPELFLEERAQRLLGPGGTPPGVRLAEAAQVAVLPRLGTRGVLVDLDELIRATAGGMSIETMEVWLGPQAPADAAARLEAAGLVIAAQESRAQARERAERTPQALTVRLHLIAVAVAWALLIAVVLGVAAFDRGAADQSALRMAGVRARSLRRASRLAYAVAAGLGLLVGLVAAAVAWLLARSALPIGADPAWGDVPAMPHLLPIAALAGGAACVLAALSWLSFVRPVRT